MAPVIFLLLLALFIVNAYPQENRDHSARLGKESELVSSRPFLRHQTPTYRNFALKPFTHYPNHSFPYAHRAQSFYGPFGDYLATGYSLFSWNERRLPDLQYGSAIFKDIDVFRPIFDHVIVASDGYRDWGYSFIVGDDLIAHLTPLTMSHVTFHGVRLDAQVPRLQFTLMASRIERPWHWVEGSNIGPWMIDGVHYAETSTMLLGGRAQTRVGALRLGISGANAHIFRSTESGNTLKGVIRPDHVRIGWLGVRFTDDSPADDRGGAVVQELDIIVNGQVRPDIRPRIITHRAGVRSAVGTYSRATGEFRGTGYKRRGYPYYVDYLYRILLEEGADVSANTQVDVLRETFTIPPPGTVLRADGDQRVVVLYDLFEEPLIESVEIEALLANDYRVEAFILTEQNPRARNLQSQWRTSSFITHLRAPGNVQDLSNLARRRFVIGENTAVFTYSADAKLDLPGIEIDAEYARSARYSRYPAYMGDTPIFRRAPHYGEHGSAYFVTASHWFSRGRLGAEYFAINPDFRTRLFSRRETTGASEYIGVGFSQMFTIDLVQDNDDGDRFPEGGNRPIGAPSYGGDIDGIFPNQDENKDGIPDTNRNFNGIPDWNEPFLMYESDPNEYVYGLDLNHNDEPDRREDDYELDYPYDFDQRGFHAFAQVHLSTNWILGMGRYRTGEIAGAGRNHADYTLLSYRRKGADRLLSLFFENNMRRVRDNIQDNFSASRDNPRLGLYFDYRGYEAVRPGIQGALLFWSRSNQPDFLLYQDSYVNETYLEGYLNPWSSLNLVHKLRLRLNWQQGGDLPGGTSQRDRRLDYWTLVNRADYTWQWGRLQIKPQVKFMFLRLVDQNADRQPGGRYASRELIAEHRLIPILLVSCPLLRSTTLQLGLQGLGPLPYRLEDQVRERNSLRRRIGFLTLTNRSLYFGYDLYTILGLQRDKLRYDDPFRQSSNRDSWSFFVRTLVGFTEYGRAI